MSLVELMVGITLGLFIVAAASTLVVNQLSDNRRLLIETQVQQDLRASMDIMTRQLRRAGALTTPLVQVAMATSIGAGGAKNDFATVTPSSGGDSAVLFGYVSTNATDPTQFGFKLDNNTIKTLIGNAWQELTDSSTLKVTALSFETKNRDLPSTGVPTDPAPGAKTATLNLAPVSANVCWGRV